MLSDPRVSSLPTFDQASFPGLPTVFFFIDQTKLDSEKAWEQHCLSPKSVLITKTEIQLAIDQLLSYLPINTLVVSELPGYPGRRHVLRSHYVTAKFL